MSQPPSDRKTAALDKRLGWVVPQTGASEGSVFPLEHGTIIGSGRRANVQVPDNGVASAHVELVVHEGTWWLRDLGAGPTRVSDRSVPANQKVALADGEPIELGPLRLVFKCL